MKKVAKWLDIKIETLLGRLRKYYRSTKNKEHFYIKNVDYIRKNDGKYTDYYI